MAFVSGAGVAVPAGAKASAPLCALRMSGYGDYSYSTDRTKGHVNQYYVDKARSRSDWGNRNVLPASEGDAVLGRTAKGAVAVPEFGIPQLDDPVLGFGPDSMVDPRIAEADGAVWRWDAGFVDESMTLASCADISDEAVADEAFAKFRGSVLAERGAMITKAESATASVITSLRDGLYSGEAQLLTASGQRLANVAGQEKIATISGYTWDGQPQTEIPGKPFVKSIGAMDYMDGVEGGDVVAAKVGAFWKPKAPKEVPYKRPMGANTPELPYNTVPRLVQAAGLAVQE
ncbi:hypothetical protein FVE85_5140 [Porphyridium purpureum]|uniref:Uncharacterized protein n=1 Tax=Porphyridium purpureum TaxID=35688 RepID=A0A5J4Z2M2_PORPP|nr:Chain 3H, LRC5 [Porphyridium purpureum]6KGX_aH Chain aH, LRC5 [Porphyridium purpureum]7EZX_3P Chain 3P, LRC5 [Porphyridium purpureum]7EZX_aP Chain aP, LRC5 [Porphyridium purpureum]7Y4L_33 Chain 33, LRC5 [Porphyridium purpureum]7Y4L_a3 Chain a3, LRC5 [Porphyridium purpureum]7Y5E_33 Chain 33, LRC5 [Porphyridium purpureum]7Y5E_a3 Chain a3, LRC5 [Porphyridium purpureum]7Y7A_3B Chain 3B, LRC5 [Porphyridium purpureum]7Y7A_3d Chain 3d, LRC5 [Porphyridium purpureum]7Y7A_aB Chain aB, LRC5 [Porp|eukprot:POR7571..scf295_1